jgi:hypothetical protein
VKVQQIGSTPIAIHGIYYLSDQHHGLFEIEQTKYTVNMGDTLKIHVKRIGDSRGDASVLVQAWPMTAQADREYKDVVVSLKFKGGETVQEVSIETLHTSEKLDTRFMCVISNPESGVVGFNYSTTITIKYVQSIEHGSSGDSGRGAALIGIVIGCAVACAVVVTVLVVKRSRGGASELGLVISKEKLVK